MSHLRFFLIAYHRAEGDPLTSKLLNSLGMYRTAEDDNIGAVLVSPERLVRKLSDMKVDTISGGKSNSDIQIGSEKSNYTVSLVGNYPGGVNDLANKRRAALLELKSKIDMIQENDAIHLLLEFNFGYSGKSIGIALVVKEYLEKKLNGKTDNIVMTLQGGGGALKDDAEKESIIADINAVFGIDISDKQERYFVSRQQLEQSLPVFQADKKQGIALVPFMKAYQSTIPNAVGKEEVSKNLKRVQSKEHWGKGGSRASTPTKDVLTSKEATPIDDATHSNLLFDKGMTFYSPDRKVSSASDNSSIDEIKNNNSDDSSPKPKT